MELFHVINAEVKRQNYLRWSEQPRHQIAEEVQKMNEVVNRLSKTSLEALQDAMGKKGSDAQVAWDDAIEKLEKAEGFFDQLTEAYQVLLDLATERSKASAARDLSVVSDLKLSLFSKVAYAKISKVEAAVKAALVDAESEESHGLERNMELMGVAEQACVEWVQAASKGLAASTPSEAAQWQKDLEDLEDAEDRYCTWTAFKMKKTAEIAAIRALHPMFYCGTSCKLWEHVLELTLDTRAYYATAAEVFAYGLQLAPVRLKEWWEQETESANNRQCIGHARILLAQAHKAYAHAASTFLQAALSAEMPLSVDVSAQLWKQARQAASESARAAADANDGMTVGTNSAPERFRNTWPKASVNALLNENRLLVSACEEEHVNSAWVNVFVHYLQGLQLANRCFELTDRADTAELSEAVVESWNEAIALAHSALQAYKPLATAFREVRLSSFVAGSTRLIRAVAGTLIYGAGPGRLVGGQGAVEGSAAAS